MRLTLVGVRRNRRAIVWRNVLKFALVVVPIPGLATALTRLAVTKLWSTNALLLGFAAGVAIVIVVVIGAYCTELRKLPTLPDDRPPAPPA